ncbi:MAG: hypothetical protein CMM07_00410 [Rhodopirellula sp.]|nr:hypothetical protein [Rhodopirellula sp.]
MPLKAVFSGRRAIRRKLGMGGQHIKARPFEYCIRHFEHLSQNLNSKNYTYNRAKYQTPD